MSNKTPVFPLVNCKVNALNLQEIFLQEEKNLGLNRVVLKVYSSQLRRSIDTSVLCALRAEMLATDVRKKSHFCRGGKKTSRVKQQFPSMFITRLVEEKKSKYK